MKERVGPLLLVAELSFGAQKRNDDRNRQDGAERGIADVSRRSQSFGCAAREMLRHSSKMEEAIFQVVILVRRKRHAAAEAVRGDFPVKLMTLCF